MIPRPTNEMKKDPKLLDEFYRQRLLSQIKVQNNCWIWQGNIGKDGYSKIRCLNKYWKAHRLSYSLIGGKELHEGMTLDHLCRNRACINPDHLEEVTTKENVLRGVGPTAINAKKTHCIHGHKYTPENTLHEKKGRACRTCRREYYRLRPDKMKLRNLYQRRRRATKRAERDACP